MSPIIPFRTSRSGLSVLMVLLVIFGAAFASSPVSAGSRSVKTQGHVTEARIDTESGCEKWTLVLWAAIPGATSYTMDMHDTLGYSFVATFPPFQYDAAFGGLPAVGGGQHRHALTYQGGYVGGCQANDVARYTIRSLVANFDDDKGRIVGTVLEEDGSPIADVPVSISGPSTLTKRTNGGGGYGTTVKKGRYTVSAPAGYCVRGTDPCKRSKAVDVDDATSVHFVRKACPLEPAGVDDPPAALAQQTANSCKHLKVEIIRIKAAGDSGWTESSGKKLLGNAKVPVGFTQPTHNGDFLWQCRTGCLNVRIRVTDSKTGKVVLSAAVAVSVLAAPGAVTADAPNGVVCPALPYAEGCGERIERALDGKKSLDVYYWLPGVIERTNARIYVQVRATGYPRVNKTQNVVVVANAPVKHTLRFRKSDASTLLWWGSLKQGLSFTDLGSYCEKAVAGLNNLAGGGVSAGYLSVITQYAAKLVRQLEKNCGLLDFGQLVAKLTIITPWKLYLWFLPRLGVPRNGLLGTSNIINRPAQLLINFAGFFDVFNAGLVAYLYDRVDLWNPVTPSLQGNPLRLEIFEVSHRLASGKVKDALYVRFTGKQQGTPTKVYGAYSEGGYYPGCWLNPKLNEAEFSVFDLDPCRTKEP